MMAASPGDSRKVSLAHGYDFGGPIGVGILTVLLPPLVYAFNLLCNDVSGCPAPSLLHPSTLTLDALKKDIGWHGWPTIFNTNALLAAVGWIGWDLLCHTILPAQQVEGSELQSGGRLRYRFNAFYTAVFTLSLLAAGTAARGAEFEVWTFIDRNYVPLFTANFLISFALATFSYIRSFSVKPGNKGFKELAAGGDTGNVIYDWFIGRELNPRIKLPFLPEIDIKSYFEMRPGLIGWLVLDYAMMAKQYRNFGYVTDSMLITCAAQSIYVLDGLFMEPAILTTIDIVTDGFGFMLAFGDIAWLPFTYDLQARYLAMYPVHLGPWAALTAATLATGFYIFRSSNNEKNRFRNNPENPAVKNLEYIETSAGKRLLVSGWWGRARHINYLGDWVMSWTYCLPTGLAGYQIIRHKVMPAVIPEDGFRILTDKGVAVVHQGNAKGWGMVVTYFFMVYFAVLLVHRERRDEAKCRAKYGKDWEEYRKRVPWRIIPYVY